MARKVSKIIVHCSATKEGKQYTVRDIDKWHRAKGYKEVGYHYVIYLDGTVAEGRDIEKTGAHCQGQNTGSIGICYIGGLDALGKAKDTRTKEQRESLSALIKELKDKYPGVKVFGHRDFSSKACPCFDAKAEYNL